MHQIRNSIKYVASKDMKEFTKDLKTVYKAITLDQASNNLLHMEEKWGTKYKAAIKSWQDNWEEFTTYFKYPGDIRKLIYTTNSIENFNRQLRKYTKTKSSYPTDDSLSKSIYLSIKEITKKWTRKVQNWGQIVSQLSIYFEGRLSRVYTEFGTLSKNKSGSTTCANRSKACLSVIR